MKEGIHPEYYQATVTCNCGNTFVVGSTKKEIHVEVCPKCKTDLTRGLLDATRKEEPAEDYSIKKTQTAKMRFLEKQRQQ